jgi:hypothetical protein
MSQHSIVELETSRRRYLMQQVMKRVQGYQTIWMTTEMKHEVSYAKGRYLAAKDFYDWLADGGEISKAQEYLDAMKVKARKESEAWDTHRFNAQLNEQVERVRPKQKRLEELKALPRESLTPEQLREWWLLQTELNHSFTVAQIEKGFKHAYTPGFTITREEDQKLHDLAVQHGAGRVEAEHLERLLRDPFVSGKTDAPPPPPPRAVVDETEYDDENDEPDPT